MAWCRLLLLCIATFLPVGRCAPFGGHKISALWRRISKLTSEGSTVRYATTKQVSWVVGEEFLMRMMLLRQNSNVADEDSAQSTNEPITAPEGYTFDPCFYHRDCTDPRLCVRGDLDAACSGAANCFCLGMATQVCDKCNECELFLTGKESCLAGVNDKPDETGICGSLYTVYEGITVEKGCDSFPYISPAPIETIGNGSSNNYQNYSSTATRRPEMIPSPSSTPSNLSPSPSNILSPFSSPGTSSSSPAIEARNVDSCIDARAMSHLPASERVFAADRRAGVLCDNNGSCATPGHMIVFMGEGMTMRTYCQSFSNNGCLKRVMLVNSPRFRRSLRILSFTDKLAFTSFAAKYETPLEEHAIGLLIRIGL